MYQRWLPITFESERINNHVGFWISNQDVDTSPNCMKSISEVQGAVFCGTAAVQEGEKKPLQKTW